MDFSTSELCGTCSAIDFAALMWSRTMNNVLVGPRSISLGTIEDIKNREYVCELCKLITTRLDWVIDPDVRQHPGDQCRLLFSKFEEEALGDKSSQVPGGKGADRFLARIVTVEIVPVSFTGFMGPMMPDRFYKAGEDNPTTRQATVQARPWTLLCLQGCTNPIPTVDQLCTGGTDLLAPPKHTRFSGRLRNDKINPLLYQRWLQICKKHHGDDCWNQHHPRIEGLRVIDVQDMAIRPAPGRCEYVALSYCWGSSKTTLLKQENVERLTHTQSLRFDILPDTIADAIEVTRNAGIRYLWVDALCIIQDDPLSLQSQLPQMAQIYTQAIFTIVAAASDNADHGLAGIRSGSRNVEKNVITLSDISLILAPEKFLNRQREMELADCRWRSRAWTLQEELFSRRRLYFNANRVLWQCPSSMFQEDTVKEVHAAFVSDDEKSDFNFEVPWLTKDAEELDFMWYEQFVSEYSTRHLSFTSDTLNALAGLSEEIRRIGGISFHWGHPEKWFVRSLLWQTNFECTRNAGAQRTTTKTGQEILTPFPSWSWSAWVGNLEDDRFHYPGSAYDLLNLSSFVVIMYRCRLDAQLRPVPYSCINTTDLSSYEQAISDKASSSHEGALPHDWVRTPRSISLSETAGGPDVLDSGHLQFWSSIAKVYMGHEPSKNARRMCYYDLLNSRGEKIVLKAQILSTDMLDWDNAARFDQYPAPVSWLRHKYVHGLHHINAVAVMRSEAFHFSVPMMVTVLLVVQDGPTFMRIGTARMNNTDWLGLEPEWSLVTLG